MMKSEWAIEMIDILAGTPWRISKAWVNLKGAMCFARVLHVDGEVRSVLLSCDQFATTAQRYQETRGQLGI